MNPGTTRSHAAFLRAIAHVPMQPFRAALEELGLHDVASYGMSGNFLFYTDVTDLRLLEIAIADRLEAVTFVRTLSQVARAVAADPYGRERGGAVAFLARRVSAARRRQFENLEFEGDPPLLRGRTVYFTERSRMRGRTPTLNPEALLKTPATVRSSSVVARVLALMKGS